MKQGILKHVALAILVAFFGTAGHAQHASIKTVDGFLHVFNGKPHSFTMQVSGKSVDAKEVGGNPAFTIDDQLVQLLVVPRKNFDPDRKLKESELLLGHQQWEFDYLKQEVFGNDIKADVEPFKLGERSALFWSFVRSKYKTEFDRDSFMIVPFADGIMGLSSPVKVGEELSSSRERLSKILKSVQFSDKPFDIAKLADSIRKGIPVS